MTRFLAAFLTLLTLAAPALAQTRALPPGEIRSNGDITFGNALKLGKRDAGKTIITPDTLQILSEGSSGSISGMSVRRPGAPIARPLSDRATDMESVLDWGAKCDGSTDDTSAIAAAFSAGVRSLFIPAERSCLVSNLAVPAYRQIVGVNRFSALKVKAGATVGVTLGDFSALRLLSVDGNGAAQTGNTTTCIQAVGARAVTLDRVSASACTKHGFEVKSSTDRANSTFTEVLNSHLSGYVDGLHWEDSGNIRVNGGSLAGGDSGAGDGGSIFGSSDISFDSVTFEGGANTTDPESGNGTGIYARAGLTDGFLDPTKAYSQRITVRSGAFRNLRYFGVLFAGKTLRVHGGSFVNIGHPENLANWTRTAVVGPGSDMGVDGADFDRVGGGGIDFGGTTGCSATNNTFRSTNVFAIEVNSAQNCLVQGNKVYSSWLGNAFPSTPIKPHIIVQRDVQTIQPALRVRASNAIIANNHLFPGGGANRAVQVADDGSDTRATLTYVQGNIAKGWGAGAAFDNGSPSTVFRDNTTDDAPTANGAWTAYTPTLSCPSGSLTNASATGRFFIAQGGAVHVQIAINITTNGTCAGYGLVASLPRQIGQAGGKLLGRGGSTGVVSGDLSPFDSSVAIQRLPGQDYPGENGTTLTVSGSYLPN